MGKVFSSKWIGYSFGIFWLTAMLLLALKALSYFFLSALALYELVGLALAIISFSSVTSAIIMATANTHHQKQAECKKEEV